MQIDINIEQIVAESVAAALAPEKIQPIIQKNLDEAVKDAITEQFSWRSPFREMLKEKLAGVMPTDIDDLARYGDLVVKSVKGMLAESQQQAIRQTIEEKLASMLKPLPSSMKLSELIAKLTEHFADSYEREGSLSPTFHAEEPDATNGYWDFCADPRSDVSKYGCAIKMRFDKEGTCWSLKMEDRDAKALILGPSFAADALVLNLYTGGIKIERDRVDTDEIYYPDADD